MIDNTVPTTQFHPYQPPQVDEFRSSSRTGLSGILSKLGISGSTFSGLSKSVQGMNVGSSVTQARDWARSNPSKSLGALAVLAIGVGLMNRRRLSGTRGTR